MRKVTLTAIGLLGLLLLCGSREVLAQTDTSAFPPGSPGSDATDSRIQGIPSIDVDAGTPGTASPGTQSPGMTGTEGAGGVATGTEEAAGGADANSAALRQYVVQLQGEVARLQQELAQVRSELANVAGRNTGAGGSGQAGAGGSGQAGAGGSGQTGVAPTPAPTSASAGGTSPDTAQRGSQTGDTVDPGASAVVHAIFTGKVRSVSNRRLVLVDDIGEPFTVEVGAQTRFISKGQRISAQELKEGTPVRATVDMLSGRNQAMEVTTLPER